MLSFLSQRSLTLLGLAVNETDDDFIANHSPYNLTIEKDEPSIMSISGKGRNYSSRYYDLFVSDITGSISGIVIGRKIKFILSCIRTVGFYPRRGCRNEFFTELKKVISKRREFDVDRDETQGQQISDLCDTFSEMYGSHRDGYERVSDLYSILNRVETWYDQDQLEQLIIKASREVDQFYDEEW